MSVVGLDGRGLSPRGSFEMFIDVTANEDSPRKRLAERFALGAKEHHVMLHMLDV